MHTYQERVQAFVIKVDISRNDQGGSLSNKRCHYFQEISLT